MALKVLLLRSKLTELQKLLSEQRTAAEGFATREAELATAIDEVTNNEERATVETAVAEFDTKCAENAAEQQRLSGEIKALETQISELEAAGSAARTAPPSGAERTDNHMPNMQTAETRTRFFGMTVSQRDAFVARDEVKDFITRLREFKGTNKRSVTGSELGIPEVMLDILRDNTDRYSKLLQYCTVKQVKGAARQNVAGTVPEAIWTEAVGSLNDIDFVFTQVEVDGYKVGGYVAIPNSQLEDDQGLDLLMSVMDGMGQAIGLAVDKAIPYGTGTKMPVGFVTRLAAASQPSWWGTNQGTFTDLHTSNILVLNIASATGVSFFQSMIAALGVASPKYSNGVPCWITNRKTHIDIISRCLAFDFNAALLAGMKNTFPVIGGDIIEEEYMSDYEVIGGYLSLQLMAERSGSHIRSSDIPLMLQDQTLVVGTQRYDGKPVRGEAFVAVSYDNTSVTTSKTFGTDYANADIGTLIVTTAAGSEVGDTTVTVAGATGGAILKYKIGPQNVAVTNGQKISTDWTTITSGSDATAATGNIITVVEIDSKSKAVKTGFGFVTAKAGT
ncbi:MAG: phage major capsid protein [Clostridia bacterium]|nr:phage major capsid protein [Clostridia bacterium]